MRPIAVVITLSTAVLLVAGAGEAAGPPPPRPGPTCPVDAVVSGMTCMDKYEASVWRVPNSTTTNRALVAAIQSGTATAAGLRAAGATLLGLAPGDYAPCAASGQNCADDIYAASLPGVMPSGWITWFQAQQACKNSRKRLPTNAEWQAAATGSPDPGSDNGTTDCNTSSTLATALTGSRRNCVSARGAFDMVGNLAEWVAEWIPRSTICGTWSSGLTLDDLQCLAGAATTGEPGVLLRGGPWFDATAAGPFTMIAGFGPSTTDIAYGFRCAR